MKWAELFQRVEPFDVRVSRALQAWRNGPMNVLAQALSWSGAGGVWFSLGFGVWFLETRGLQWVPQQVSFLSGMVCAFFALVVGSVIKSMAKRPRPFMSPHGITAAIWAPGKARSFPSTHAATAVALAAYLLMSAHPWAWPMLAWALGVTWSRVWLGVHYVSDVTGGAVLGVLIALAPWEAWVRAVV